MLQSWIANIKESISATITGYLLQGLAVVPFLVALGFAIAALTIWLKSHLGDLLTYVIMAAGFALIGVIVFLFGRNVEEHHSTNETTAAAKSNGYDHAASFLDSNSAALIGLIASHPSTAFKALKMIVRNIPALIVGAALGGLLFSDATRDTNSSSVSPEDRASL